MGCAFAGLILLVAVSAAALVSLAWHSSQQILLLSALALLLLVGVVVVFRASIRRVAGAFGEQDRLRRQLMADVAHELRTPLAILQGRIEGFLDGVYPNDEEHLTELLGETRHLSRLVEDLGTLASADAGALDLRKEEVDLGELVRETAASLDRPVAMNVPEDLAPIEVDPVRIRQVLLNLLVNADHHTPADGVVAVAARDRPGGRGDRSSRIEIVEIGVRDTGSGIPPEELDHLFERFRKGRDSRGSGLGLAIARELVRAHGGDVRIESSVGEGTTVTLWLPR